MKNSGTIGGSGDTIAFDSTKIIRYAKISDVYWSWSEVRSLPQTNVFFPDSTDKNIGIGWLDAHYLDDENGSHFINTNGTEIFNYYEWLIAVGAVNPNKALVYPNPTSSNVFIKLTDDYVTRMDDIQTITYQLYDFNKQKLITTLISYDPLDEVEIPAKYITIAGTYIVICNVSYLNTIGQLATDTFKVQFIKR